MQQKKSNKFYLIFFLFLSLILTNLLFVNCGGSRTASNSNTNNGDSLQNISSLDGTWVQDFCSSQGGQSNKNVQILSQIDNKSITLNVDVLAYVNSNCSGSGNLVGTSSYGTIVFSSTAIDGTGNYFRGTWTSPVSTTKIIYALKNSTTLCIIGDIEPTVFPSSASITDQVNLMVSLNICYKKR